jgi:outer membrane protein assembly factor BamD|tara:strand:- start:278 stop:1006 length:729 start_codon:yes stop_codon:yes gene_type:complete
MVAAYKEGLKELNEGDVLFAAKKFNEVEVLFPQSEWASKSILMSAYSYYSQNYYSDAIFELNRFIELHPKNKNIAYANFLLAICYYEQIVDEKKDLFSIIESKKKFNYIIKEYPNTDYAIDAEFKLNLIENILASKEMYVARFYMKKKKWIPAINRFKTVVNDYDATIYTEEALHRLVEIYYSIGLIEESKKYAVMLGYNYQSSEWYVQSFKVFNKDYKSKTEDIKKNTHNTIVQKVKSLLQ